VYLVDLGIEDWYGRDGATRRHELSLLASRWLGVMRRLVLLATLLAFVGSGCGTGRGGSDAASGRNVAERFLAEVSGGAPDLGWSLLHSETRAALFSNDRSRYDDLVRSSDWSGFHWRSLPGYWDEPYLYLALFEFARESTPGPSILISPVTPGYAPILHIDPVSRHGTLGVRSDGDGAVRIWATP
jgi:hypothetical protein